MVVVLAVALYFGLRSEPDDSLDSNGAEAASAAGEAVAIERPPATSPAHSEAGAEAEAAGVRRVERAVRDALRDRIREARNQRANAGAGDDPTSESESENTHAVAQGAGAEDADARERGAIDRHYIRDAVHEVVPLLRECYELRLEAEPDMQGRLLVEFRIGGEPDVGGVIEEVLIGEDSSLQDDDLHECIRETFYTLELPAPEAGGYVDVTYPIQLAPDEPDEASAPAEDQRAI